MEFILVSNGSYIDSNESYINSNGGYIDFQCHQRYFPNFPIFMGGKVASFLVAISDIYNFPRLLNVVWLLGYPSHSAAHGPEHISLEYLLLIKLKFIF